MPPLDKQVKTTDEVISYMKKGFRLRAPIGSTKYAYLVKKQVVKDKDLIYVPIGLIDEMFDNGLLYSSSMTRFHNYYRLKGDE